ncbi:MAG: hypothetical protein Q8K70_12595 [Bacteroidota bacterium]|nr:hypothetical protein [Bacteroidota bacterium]
MNSKTILITLNLLFLSAVILFGFKSSANKANTEQFEYLQISAIESVIAGGAGRSRLITTNPKGEFIEVKMNNFYSMVGINFSNIRENDKIVCEKINELAAEGWELCQTNSAVESKETSNGIFITRYTFKRKKQ